jgi:hypothetical protein
MGAHITFTAATPGEQRQYHGRFHQHGFAQATGMHHRDFTFGIEFAQRHEQTEEKT